MDKLEQKEIDTKRGFHYHYYASPSSQVTSQYTLLLCHGWPDGSILWQYVVPHLLPTGLRLIVPDLLGYGGTSKPTDAKEFAWPGMVEDAKEILKHEGVEGDVIPVGHDWYVLPAIFLPKWCGKQKRGIDRRAGARPSHSASTC